MTQDELKKRLHYDPASGAFSWLVSKAAWIKPGHPAGYKKNGYTQIRLDGTLYYAHRLAFLYMVGYIPAAQVDHINGNPSDNSWANLREATSQDNVRNCAISVNNTSGVTGVVWDKRKAKWMAKITVDYKEKFLGYFDDLNTAAATRKQAEALYGFHCNHGRKAHA